MAAAGEAVDDHAADRAVPGRAVPHLPAVRHGGLRLPAGADGGGGGARRLLPPALLALLRHGVRRRRPPRREEKEGRMMPFKKALLLLSLYLSSSIQTFSFMCE